MNYLTTLAMVGLLGVVACGGDSDLDTCVDLCTEGQAGNCTVITGSCSSFCTSLGNVQDDAGCADERDSYQACLSANANVCSNNCDATETALANCVGIYCAANQSNADCVVLANSF